MEKIEIKSINGNVLFSHEEENNTLKKTVELADLRGADLRGAIIGRDSTGANLSINNNEEICIVGPIGSRLDYTTAYKTDKGIYIKCGCFFGAIENFEEAVEETHKGHQHEKTYKELIRFISSYFS